MNVPTRKRVKRAAVVMGCVGISCSVWLAYCNESTLPGLMLSALMTWVNWFVGDPSLDEVTVALNTLQKTMAGMQETMCGMQADMNLRLDNMNRRFDNLNVQAPLRASTRQSSRATRTGSAHRIPNWWTGRGGAE
jgi:hypothetical protein